MMLCYITLKNTRNEKLKDAKMSEYEHELQELEIWLADGPYSTEILARFEAMLNECAALKNERLRFIKANAEVAKINADLVEKNAALMRDIERLRGNLMMIRNETTVIGNQTRAIDKRINDALLPGGADETE